MFLTRLIALMIPILIGYLSFGGTMGCGGGGGEGPDDTPTPEESPIPPNALLPLVGTWVTSVYDEDGFRYGLTFSDSSGSPSPTSLDCYLFTVEVDGTDLGGVEGESTVEDSTLVLSFFGFDPLFDTYSVNTSTLTFGDLEFAKISRAIPTLEGIGSIGGIISVARINSLNGHRQSFVPGQVLVGHRGGEAVGLSIAGTGDARVIGVVPGIAAVLENRHAEQVALSISVRPRANALREIADLTRWTLRKVKELSSDPRVRFAEPNYVYHASAVPNDKYYQDQWHYPAISLPEAWDITTGSDSVVAAVVDTGIVFSHPDLAERITDTGYDFVDAFNSKDGDGPDPDPTDPGDGEGGRGSSWHGTHVAGTIGAVTNNGTGVSGVTWKGKIMPVRVLGAGGSGTIEDIANGVLYAAGLPNSSGIIPVQKAGVINLSLGGPGLSFTMDDAIAKTVAANVVVVAAAGNENASLIGSPAASPGAICVAATGYDSQRAPYSNYGLEVDIAAPGGDKSVDLNGDSYTDGVLSTLVTDDGTPVYEFYQGTSMATPHVAGVVALLLATNPALTPADIARILTETATDVGDPGRDNEYGFGIVNAHRAVLAAQGNTPGGPSLHLSAELVALSSTTTNALVEVSNGGSGSIAGLTATVSGVLGGDWLSASLDRQTTPATLTIQADTVGLDVGTYTGQVNVGSDAGSATVNVTLTVASDSGGTSSLLYVVALDGTTGEPVYLAAASSDLSYAFLDIPVGTYFVLGSTDFNGDGIICDDSEWCGAYPDLAFMEPVPVIPDGFWTNIDFQIGPQVILQSPDGSDFAISIGNLLQELQ